jgi:predicted alpha/beta superfamily hydrolase
MKLPISFFPIITVLFLQLPQSINAQDAQPFLKDSIYSAILQESRELHVILPNGYQPGSAQRYEVLYILDGEWYQQLVPFTYNFAQSAGYLPSSIFVLIRNRYRDGRNLRDRDFSPTHIADDSISGGADRFYDFLTKEVVPYIEQKYPVNGQRSLLGSSYSGLFSVYAFLKGPAFFQSFIASDPNLNFDQHYLSKLAAQTLLGLASTPGTLFIAGRTNTYREGGMLTFDSVLTANAPAVLHWRCMRYDNETHYSVQLKAFYDGLRFSHYGYSAKAPEFHPMKGMLSGNKSFTIYSLNDIPTAHVTVDGSEPTSASPFIPRDSTFSITAPASIRIKTFANRASYVKNWKSDFSIGQLLPGKSPGKKTKNGLSYQLFNGSWDTLPNTSSLVPAQSGVVDSLVKINSLLHQRTAFLLIDGFIDITEDAEYIFHTIGFDAVQLTVGGKTLLQEQGINRNPSPSFIVTLKKGRYPLRLAILHKTPTLEPHFTIFRSKSGTDHWWENRLLDF